MTGLYVTGRAAMAQLNSIVLHAQRDVFPRTDSSQIIDTLLGHLKLLPPKAVHVLN
jgi:hypothetical protein